MWSWRSRVAATGRGGWRRTRARGRRHARIARPGGRCRPLRSPSRAAVDVAAEIAACAGSARRSSSTSTRSARRSSSASRLFLRLPGSTPWTARSPGLLRVRGGRPASISRGRAPEAAALPIEGSTCIRVGRRRRGVGGQDVYRIGVQGPSRGADAGAPRRTSVRRGRARARRPRGDGAADPESAGATIGRASAKAWRYVAEMEEIAATQAAAGLPPELFRAFATVYAELAPAPSQALRRTCRTTSRSRRFSTCCQRGRCRPSRRGSAGDESGSRDLAATRVLGASGADERRPDQRAAGPAQRLGGNQLAVGLDDREARQLVAAVEREPREDLSAEVRGADAVAGEAEAVVDCAAAPEDRQMGRGDVDRPAPGVRDAPPAQLREEATQVVARRCRTASRSSSSRSSRRPPKPIRPPPQPNAIRPSRVVRR